MARRCQAFLVSSDCSWAECDVDRGRSEAIKNTLEHANLLLEGYFRVLYAPLFLVTHLMRFFGVSHRFETPIKGYRVMDSYMLLTGFEFSVGMYG